MRFSSSVLIAVAISIAATAPVEKSTMSTSTDGNTLSVQTNEPPKGAHKSEGPSSQRSIVASDEIHSTGISNASLPSGAPKSQKGWAGIENPHVSAGPSTHSNRPSRNQNSYSEAVKANPTGTRRIGASENKRSPEEAEKPHPSGSTPSVTHQSGTLKNPNEPAANKNEKIIGTIPSGTHSSGGPQSQHSPAEAENAQPNSPRTSGSQPSRALGSQSSSEVTEKSHPSGPVVSGAHQNEAPKSPKNPEAGNAHTSSSTGSGTKTNGTPEGGLNYQAAESEKAHSSGPALNSSPPDGERNGEGQKTTAEDFHSGKEPQY